MRIGIILSIEIRTRTCGARACRSLQLEKLIRMNKSMRLSALLTSALLLFAVWTQTACNKRDRSESRAGANTQTTQTPTTQAAPPQDGVRRISISELQEALEKGLAVVVDVRGSVEYKLGHIKGALSVPLGLIARQLNELPKDKLIVTYCA